MSGSPPDYDVLILSDLRYPGGNSASIVEEIKAQASAGYSTGLMHVAAPHMLRRRSLNRKIVNCVSAGMAELVPADRAVSTHALVVRQPRLFTRDPDVIPRISTDATVLVVNHPPTDGLHGPDDAYYDVGEVRARVERLFGETRWAPIGPLVRGALLAPGVELALNDEDWVNIVDVDEWSVDRSRFCSDRPVVGRHSRSHLTKWPASAADIVAAYPTDGGVEVRILGGAEPAVKLLGAVPAAWTVHPFGSMPAQRFLREIDFFVYFHHPDWVEAFGRNIIEAMASGCPAILPPHFKPVFGDGCLYAAPSGVRSLVEALYADPVRYREQSERGIAHVDEHFGQAAHLRRLAELIGEPVRTRRGAVRRGRGRRTLLVADQPRGLGAVTRAIRAAGALPAGGEAVLLAPWPALECGRRAGLLCELLPEEELAPGQDERLAERVAATVRLHAIDDAVVDAGVAGHVILAALAQHGVPAVALGARGGGAAVVAVGDGTVEAGVAGEPPRMLALRPREPPLDRAAARAALGVAADVPLALLCAGAGARAVLVARILLIADELARHGWTVVFAEPAAASREIDLPHDVLRVAIDSLPRVLAAFDVAVAHAGRTLVPELVEARVPALLVALRADRSQAARGEAAQRAGIALWSEALDESLLESVAALSDAAVRERLATACAAVSIEDAAPAVAAALATRPAPAGEVAVTAP